MKVESVLVVSQSGWRSTHGGGRQEFSDAQTEGIGTRKGVPQSQEQCEKNADKKNEGQVRIELQYLCDECMQRFNRHRLIVVVGHRPFQLRMVRGMRGCMIIKRMLMTIQVQVNSEPLDKQQGNDQKDAQCAG